jgi:hypothetical protein
LVHEEFLAQGEKEKNAGLPISPNMDPSTVNQIQTQLSFTQLIVHPLFECIVDLFPRTVSLMDLVIDNIKHWGGYEVPVVTKRRRATEGSKNKNPSHGIISEGSRRLSLAAGTIDIPDSIQKYFQKGKGRNILRNAHRSSDDYASEQVNLETNLEEDEG